MDPNARPDIYIKYQLPYVPVGLVPPVCNREYRQNKITKIKARLLKTTTEFLVIMFSISAGLRRGPSSCRARNAVEHELSLWYYRQIYRNAEFSVRIIPP